MKNIWIGIITTIATLGLLLGFPQPVAALTETIGDLQVTTDHPMFSDDTNWYPGLTLTKTISVKNIGAVDHAAYIDTANTAQTGGLADILHFSVFNNSSEIFGSAGTKHLRDFWNAGRLTVSTLVPNETTDIAFTADMPTDADNDYQGVHASFDLRIGFSGSPEVITAQSGDTGGTGGSASAPVCTDTKPGSAPTLLQATGGINSAVLTWSEGAGPLTYYLVAFGLTPGAITYGNPNIGPSGTTTYTVTNLSGGTTYYFKVRSGNGCMPGDYSNELTATPTGIVVTGIPAGFTAGVLGTASESAGISPTPSPVEFNGMVAGQQSRTSGVFLIFWLLLLLLLLFLLWILLRKRREHVN